MPYAPGFHAAERAAWSSADLDIGSQELSLPALQLVVFLSG
jgi:hypothetical protein